MTGRPPSLRGGSHANVIESSDVAAATGVPGAPGRSEICMLLIRIKSYLPGLVGNNYIT